MSATKAQHEYFNARMEALGIPVQNAIEHGFKPDGRGNIQQLILSFTGKSPLYVNRRGTNARAIETIERRKTFSENGGGIERYHEKLYITRLNPANIRPGEPKYRYPSKELTGYGSLPMPGKKAIEAFNAGIRGGIGVATEGAFKRAALDVNGIEAVSFSGIGQYKINDDLAEYLTTRQFSDFVILYDADARDLNAKPGKTISARRTMNFAASAKNFAAAFFDLCEREKLNTRLHFAMVHPDTAQKGIDDLLEHGERAAIVQALGTFKTSEYFIFLRLTKYTYAAAIQKFFAITNHVLFYNAHASTINHQEFEFAGGRYRLKPGAAAADLFAPEASTFFELLNHPANVGTPGTSLTVDKYLSEVEPQLDAILSDHARVCIAAPTGAGKNAFLLGHKENGKKVPGYFERHRVPAVIAVPTVSLAKQIEKNYKIPALYGGVSIRAREKATSARVVCCTYDTIHHIRDIRARALVIDEAHNLQTQYGNIAQNKPFRADVLRRLVELFDVARQTILISGTPPRQLATYLGFTIADVTRRHNPIARVHAIEAQSRHANGLTSAALVELNKVDLNDGHIHFVYYNSRKQLEIIRKHLINARGVDEKDIAVITREHVLEGTHDVYNGIIQNERIQGARVVLCTCLIAEGLNIKNENIGTIITVGIKCPDSFAQFIARFRNMLNLTVKCIRPPECKTKNGFFEPAQHQLSRMIDQAKNQLPILEYSELEYRENLSDIDDDLPLYSNDIEPDYPYRQQLLTGVYKGTNGKWQIDILRIFAAIRERFNDFGNNTAFYAQIAAHNNIVLMGHADTDAEASAKAAADVAAANEVFKMEKTAVLDFLKNALSECPAAVVAAYHQRLKKGANRHTLPRVEALAGDLLNTPEASRGAEFATRYAALFTQKYFTDGINRYIRARFAGGGIGAPLDVLKMPGAKFGRVWARWRCLVSFAIYADKRARTALKPIHAAEVKFYEKARDAIADAAPDGVIQLSQLVKMLRALCMKTSHDTLRQICIVRIGAAEAERIIQTVFNCDTNVLPSGEKEFIITRPAAIDTRHIVKNAYRFTMIL